MILLMMNTSTPNNLWWWLLKPDKRKDKCFRKKKLWKVLRVISERLTCSTYLNILWEMVIRHKKIEVLHNLIFLFKHWLNNWKSVSLKRLPAQKMIKVSSQNSSKITVNKWSSSIWDGSLSALKLWEPRLMRCFRKWNGLSKNTQIMNLSTSRATSKKRKKS